MFEISVYTYFYFVIYISVDIPDYCGANPSDVLPDPDNCGRYYNCSMSPGHGTKRSLSPLKIATYHMECRYPDLFDVSTMMCADFETVNCPNRKEPQAPCMLTNECYAIRANL